jgi:N utilization substance protein B
MSRRHTREEAFKIIFEISFKSPDCIDEVIENYYNADKETGIEKEYFESLVYGVCSHLDELDTIIDQYSIGWKKNRISKVSLSVLWISIYEILYREDVSDGVSVNEAVELAKT